jgi:RNA polymerase sigma-70 factor (ECF subfamily)
MDEDRFRSPSRCKALSGGRFRSSAGHTDEDPETEPLAGAIDRAKEGDREAVRFLYVTYADNVYGYVRSIVREDHKAEDVTQEVFLKLIDAIRKYERRSVPFSAWLLRVARNVALDHIRRARTTPCEVVRGADESSHGLVIERSRDFREALESLPDDQRRVLVLRHIVGLSPGEIAAQLGRTEASVHGLHHRGRRVLCEHLVEMQLAPATAS